MKNDKALISRVELELTQRIQMYFPWGRIPVGVLATWNGCPADVLTERFFEMFSVSRLVVSEEIKTRFTAFLTETFTMWYDKETAKKVKQKLSLVAPQDIELERLKDDIDTAKFGEYSLNPETQGLNVEAFSPEKVKVLDLKKMVGKTVAEVGKFIVTKYSAKYHIPGIEYWEYVVKNPDKTPASLKDGNWHHFFGSMLRFRDGHAIVPCAGWSGGQFRRSADRLDYVWGSSDRVVLLEK